MNAEQREDLQVPPWYLQVARGRYTAARAAQLSGIPERTVYDWAKNGVLKPDLDATKPKAWSYRDLVFLRLLAWLRSKKMPRSEAGQRVSDLRRRLSSGEEVAVLRSDGLGLFLDDAESDAATGRAGLPGLTSFLDEFHLLAPIEAPELGRRELWGPNLLRPSEHTTISPMVMGGDPCIRDTRIPTSSILALHVERALPEEAIVLLYPELGVEQISDAITLEQKLRRAA